MILIFLRIIPTEVVGGADLFQTIPLTRKLCQYTFHALAERDRVLDVLEYLPKVLLHGAGESLEVRVLLHSLGEGRTLHPYHENGSPNRKYVCLLAIVFWV